MGETERDRHDFTRYNCNEYYQELEDAVSTFGFKAAVLIVKVRDALHALSEVKDIIMSYLSITKVIMYSHCEILWSDNSGACLGRHPTENDGAGLYNPEKYAVIVQQSLRSKMSGIWIKNSLTTYDKRKLRAFRSTYTFNTQ